MLASRSRTSISTTRLSTSSTEVVKPTVRVTRSATGTLSTLAAKENVAPAVRATSISTRASARASAVTKPGANAVSQPVKKSVEPAVSKTSTLYQSTAAAAARQTTSSILASRGQSRIPAPRVVGTTTRSRVVGTTKSAAEVAVRPTVAKSKPVVDVEVETSMAQEQSAIDEFFFPEESQPGQESFESADVVLASSFASASHDSMANEEVFEPMPTPPARPSLSRKTTSGRFNRRLTRSMSKELENAEMETPAVEISEVQVDSSLNTTMPQDSNVDGQDAEESLPVSEVEPAAAEAVAEVEAETEAEAEVVQEAESSIFTSLNFMHFGSPVKPTVEVTEDSVEVAQEDAVTTTPQKVLQTPRRSSTGRKSRGRKSRVQTPAPKSMTFDEEEETVSAAAAAAAASPRSPDLGRLVDAAIRRAEGQETSDASTSLKLKHFFKRDEVGSLTPYTDLSRQIALARQKIDSMTAKLDLNNDDDMTVGDVCRRISLSGKELQEEKIEEVETPAPQGFFASAREFLTPRASKTGPRSFFTPRAKSTSDGKTIFLGQSMNSSSAMVARIIIGICIYMVLSWISTTLGLDVKKTK